MRSLLVRAGATAAWTAADTLLRAAQAARTATYQGVILYRGDDQFDVLKIQHSNKDGAEREHLVSLTGEPRQLLRTGNRLICILPKDHMVSIDRPAGMKNFLSSFKPERLHQLAQWYDFVDQGKTRIAGRDCNGVAVKPRDQYRYGYEIWADKDTGMPLKVSLVDQVGTVMEQVMFTEISFPDAIDDAAFVEPKVDESQFRTVASNLPALDASPAQNGGGDERPQLSFAQLPPGFRVVVREQRPLGGGQQGNLEHLLLSDGISAVSVFSAVEQHSPEKTFQGVSHMGPVEAYGRTTGSYHITIIGEVPLATVRVIGDNVRPVFNEMPSETQPSSPPSGDGGGTLQ